ncbi:uncharacterized protein IUM83_18495 [Phytophthora cinnamomi]|uniref:uncharacterized protein n=1 Tax=Phytophthora cinnamomi TaxID=4785 RepID=UPI00355A6422|nr:hypothetical protein IUM83_18495 [Phytophthora cinnamomi]
MITIILENFSVLGGLRSSTEPGVSLSAHVSTVAGSSLSSLRIAVPRGLARRFMAMISVKFDKMESGQAVRKEATRICKYRPPVATGNIIDSGKFHWLCC